MFMYNIYAIVILILFDIRRFPINSLHQFQIAAAPSQDPHWSVVAFVIGRPFRVNWGNLCKFPQLWKFAAHNAVVYE